LTITHTGKEKARRIRGSSGYYAGFDTVMTVDNVSEDTETRIKTIDILIQKQKDDEDGQRYFYQSEIVETVNGTSLVLHRMDDEDGRNAVRGRKAITQDDVVRAIRDIEPKSKRDLSKFLAEQTGITIDGVEKALDRKFKHLIVDGKWQVPSYMNGAYENFNDQLAELKNEYALASPGLARGQANEGVIR
jgi:hypothetical protein